MISIQNKTSAILLTLFLAMANTACAAPAKKRTQGQAECNDCKTTVTPTLDQTKKFSDQLTSLTSLTSCGPAEKAPLLFTEKKTDLSEKKRPAERF